MDVLIESLSEAQYEKAIRAEIGYIPKYHKGKYGAKYDYHSCGQCGASIEVINNYCPNCGYRVLWTNPRCLTSYHTKEEDDELQG